MNTLQVITRSATRRERNMEALHAAVFHYKRCIFGAQYGMGGVR